MEVLWHCNQELGCKIGNSGDITDLFCRQIPQHLLIKEIQVERKLEVSIDSSSVDREGRVELPWTAVGKDVGGACFLWTSNSA